MSDSSRVALRYLKETTWGITPAAALKTLRYTSENLAPDFQTATSQEIRDDRQRTDVIRTSGMGGGDVNFELSYGTLDDLLEGAFMSAWQTGTGLSGAQLGTDLLENGTTPVSFTLEKHYADINRFETYTGMRVGSLSLSIQPGSVITGSMSFLGKNPTESGSTAGTGTAVAATETQVINAVDDVSLVQEGGSNLTITQLDITLNNNLRARPVVGQLAPANIGLGSVDVSGTLRVYLADGTLRAKALAFTRSSFRVQATDEAGNAYMFSIPMLNYTGAASPVEGPDGDVILELPFTAFRDTTSGKTIRLARTPA